MARIAKLTQSDAEKLREARPHATIAQLTKKFGISESSVYKVLNGTYVPREDGVPAPRRTRRRKRMAQGRDTVAHTLQRKQTNKQTKKPFQELSQPSPVPARPTPSLFHPSAPAAPGEPGRRSSDPELSSVLRQFQLSPADLDPVSLAAAEVLAARSRFARLLQTQAGTLLN